MNIDCNDCNDSDDVIKNEMRIMFRGEVQYYPPCTELFRQVRNNSSL